MYFQSEIEIREQLARFLAKEISLDTFEDWFAPRSWNFHQASSQVLREMVSEIELLLAEFSSRHLTEDDLRSRLGPFATSYRISFDTISSPVFNFTFTASESGSHQNLGQFFDIKAVAASL